MPLSFTSCNGANAAADRSGQYVPVAGMNWQIFCALAAGAMGALPAHAAQIGCPSGSYSVVIAQDHSTLSILFDQFELDSSATAPDATQSKTCSIAYPLNLPPNMSLGVYKVDYRGFARLARTQEASREVQYGLAPHANQHGRVFRRTVRGAHDGDYFFTENIGAGQMKRVGCGASANLNVRVELALSGAGDGMASLDTSDGTSATMIYHLNLRKCSQ